MYQSAKPVQPYVPFVFFCNRCNRTFQNITTFESHQLTHDVEQILESSLQSEINNSAHTMQSADTQAAPNIQQGNSQDIPCSTGNGTLPPELKTEPTETDLPKSTDNKKEAADVSAKIRLYTCSLCDKSYTRRDHLNRHRLIHTGVRDHVCSVCNKEFYRKDKLKRHEQVHLKDLELFCRFCGKLCRRRDGLSKHEKTHLRQNKDLPPVYDSCSGHLQTNTASENSSNICNAAKPDLPTILSSNAGD